MTQKHTPGPWAYSRNVMDTRWIVDDGIGRAIAVTAGYEPGNEANARLIAAAPDLLDAAKPIAEIAFIDDAVSWDDDDVFLLLVSVKSIRKIRAAIAKAEGGEA